MTITSLHRLTSASTSTRRQVILAPALRPKDWATGSARDGLIRTPGGDQYFRGIPFRLGPESLHEKRWLVLSTRPDQNSTRSVQIPLQQRASFLCVASFCDWDKNEGAPPNLDAYEQVGQRLAEVILVYEGGTQNTAFPCVGASR